MTTIELNAPSSFRAADLPTDAAAPSGGGRAAEAVSRVRARVTTERAAVAAYYSDGRAKLRLAATTLVLFYVGGAAMFWLHAIYRGEQGPPIAHGWHWMLDSSLGFVGLAPVVLVLLPLAQRLARGNLRLEPVMVGGLFALLTTPGPKLHELIAGAGTPLARAATSVFGTDSQVAASHAHAVENSMVTEILLQLAVGLPVYVVLALVVWLVVPASRTTRTSARRSARLELAEAS